MCTSPIQLEKKCVDGSSRVYTVPCGKCPECRAKYQSEYAALSVLEANQAGSVAFITFTYNNCSLPAWYCSLSPDNEVSCYGFGRGVFQPVESFECKPFFRFIDDNDFEHFICPSLNRDDIKALLKKYRQDYFRRHGERLDFRFSCFGEYGEKFHRPHYHMLVYGLSRDEVNRLCRKWSYGFTDVEYIERFNVDGSDAFVKVSRYVSKYVSKCDLLPGFVRLGYAEKPRRQSSVCFGRRNLNYEHLRNFI